MDEARATCALDLGGRPFFVWEVAMPKAKLGDWKELFWETAHQRQGD